MPEPLTLELMLDLLRELGSAHPYRVDGDELARRAVVYRNALSGLPGEAIRWAVRTSIQEDERFPKPARLRQLAMRWTASNVPQHDYAIAPERTCRGCHQQWASEKRFRPRVDRAGPIVSADGKWLMLEPYSRDVCKCHPLCEYWPDITAPTSEPAMAIHRSDGSVNIPFATYRLIPLRAPAPAKTPAETPTAERRSTAA